MVTVFPTSRGGGGMGPPPLIPKISKIPLFTAPSLIFVPYPKIESSLSFMSPPSPSFFPHIRKKMSLIAFQTNFTKNSSAACIFRNTIMTYLKKLAEIKSLNSIKNSFHQDLISNLYNLPHSLTKLVLSYVLPVLTLKIDNFTPITERPWYRFKQFQPLKLYFYNNHNVHQ